MKGSEVISMAVLGREGVRCMIGSRCYFIPSPTIKRICCAAYELRSVSEGMEIQDIILNTSHNALCYARALSCLVEGDDSLAEELACGSFTEVTEALCAGLGMIGIDDINKCVGFDVERNNSKSETAGNATILGQIATFIEGLGLNYDEVVDKIPYRNLLVMQKDKLHTVFGKKLHKMSGRELRSKRQNREE